MMDIIIVKSSELIGVGTVSLRKVVDGHVLEIDGVDQAHITITQHGAVNIGPSSDCTFVIIDRNGHSIAAGLDAPLLSGLALRIDSDQHDRFIRLVGSIAMFK